MPKDRTVDSLPSGALSGAPQITKEEAWQEILILERELANAQTDFDRKRRRMRALMHFIREHQ